MTPSEFPPPAVRPRIVAPVTGEHLLLEDVLEPILAGAEVGTIGIIGAPGSGKSTALRSLSARLPEKPPIELLDDPDPHRVADLSRQSVVIYAAGSLLDLPHLTTLELAPWGEDEAIEYLLAVHKEHCASVVRRLRLSTLQDPILRPKLWTLILDLLAGDESVSDVATALRRFLDLYVPSAARGRARDVCSRRLRFPDGPATDQDQSWGDAGYMEFLRNGLLPRDIAWITHDPHFTLLLAAEKLVDPETGQVSLDDLEGRLPEALISMAGRMLDDRPEPMARLEAAIEKSPKIQPVGSSLLHAARSGWRPPDNGKITWFPRATLRGAHWPGLRLSKANFDGADLSGSTLRDASLDGATLLGARLRRADLSGSSLPRLTASGADFSGADLKRLHAPDGVFVNATLAGVDLEGADLKNAWLMGADLTKAKLCRADLRGALFERYGHPREMSIDRDPLGQGTAFLAMKEALAKFGALRRTIFSGADFTGANLEGAALTGSDLRTALLTGALLRNANLVRCTLEGVEIPGAQLEGARLQGADLTGSVMTGSDFRRANLFGTLLADIDWERADLRDANLQKATFHLGTSRSGLVFGEPSEGTRIGFYTDDYRDQSYRSPEEIRVANLRGADLRGSRLVGTDFYLVDLREAKYTADQEAYLRRSGAILEARV